MIKAVISLPNTVMSNISATVPRKYFKNVSCQTFKILNMAYEYKYKSCYLGSSTLFEILAFSILKA